MASLVFCSLAAADYLSLSICYALLTYFEADLFLIQSCIRPDFDQQCVLAGICSDLRFFRPHRGARSSYSTI
jgi:hypothetical protein